jgi:hypothetical protein
MSCGVNTESEFKVNIEDSQEGKRLKNGLDFFTITWYEQRMVRLSVSTREQRSDFPGGEHMLRESTYGRRILMVTDIRKREN